MQISPIGLANTFASTVGGIAGAGLGKNLGIGSLGNELSAGLSDDTNSISMLAQLASTFGTAATSLERQVNNAVSSQLASVTVPSSSPSQQAFRSFSSLQPTQQGGSGSDAILASLVGGDASDNVEEA